MQKYQYSLSESTTKEMPSLSTSMTSESDNTDTGMTTFSSTVQEPPKTSKQDAITKTTQQTKHSSLTNRKNY